MSLPLEEQTDESLMVAYQLGDEAAFKVLYSRHAKRVFGFVRMKIQNEASAKEVFQITFMKLHRYRSRYSKKHPFLPWIFTICRNEIYDHFRREVRLREDVVEAPPELPVKTESGDKEEEFRTYDELLKGLPEKNRKAIEYRYEYDWSFEEIANQLGTSPVNARQIISRSVKLLRSLYEKRKKADPNEA